MVCSVLAGVRIEYNCREDMVHVFPIYFFTGMPQCEDAFAAIVRFLESTHPASSSDMEAV